MDMYLYSAWFSFFVTFFLCGFVSLPLFRQTDSPPHPEGHRVSTLDGVRGFLALGVFFDHSAVYHRYSETGIWKPAPAHFYTMLGECGVSLFFMITGYLFWSKLIHLKGKPRWTDLYIGRIFRIGPVYITVIALMTLLVFFRSNFYVHDTLAYCAKNFLRWFSLGIFHGWDINRYKDTSLLLAFVTWTLYYEWRFYFSLLLISFATRKSWTHLPFSGLAFSASMVYALNVPHSDHTPVLIAMFCSGMMSASLEISGFSLRLSDWMMSIIIFFSLPLTLWYFKTAYSVFPAVILSLVFYFITSGCSIFGILKARYSIRLGNISYGIYLMQGLALNIVLSLPIRAFALHSAFSYWLVIAFCGCCVVCLAAITHVAIEKPGIKLGRHVCHFLRNFQRFYKLGSTAFDNKIEAPFSR